MPNGLMLFVLQIKNRMPSSPATDAYDNQRIRQLEEELVQVCIDSCTVLNRVYGAQTS